MPAHRVGGNGCPAEEAALRRLASALRVMPVRDAVYWAWHRRYGFVCNGDGIDTWDPELTELQMMVRQVEAEEEGAARWRARRREVEAVSNARYDDVPPPPYEPAGTEPPQVPWPSSYNVIACIHLGALGTVAAYITWNVMQDIYETLLTGFQGQ